jgi:hypothetical protein
MGQAIHAMGKLKQAARGCEEEPEKEDLGPCEFSKELTFVLRPE